VLPFAEIVFDRPDDSDLWPIYSYDAKWKTESQEYAETPLEAPVELPPDVAESLRQIAVKTCKLVGMRDYARVDCRVDADGNPHVLEVNPNPSITSIALKTGLEEIGWTHARFIRNLVDVAAARSGRPLQLAPAAPPAPRRRRARTRRV
jgi:D-alanine-D-alanine ligase